MRYPTAHQIDVGCMPMVLAMQSAGLPANRDYFVQLESDFGVDVAKLEHEITQYAGGHINVASHPQISRLLYTTLKLPKPKIKSKKASATATADDILAQLMGLHPAVELIRNHRMLTKLITTYVRPMHMTFIQPNGRVYPTCRITSTETGRLSSASPNIQAVPTRTKEGLKIRKGYQPTPGRVILSIDFSGIEMRVVAWQAGDAVMTDIFRTGQDIHTRTAAMMFGIPEDQVDEKQHRYPAKRISFLILYGGGAEGLYRQMLVAGVDGWTENKCQWAIDRWFEVYADIKAYMADIGAFAIRHGYVEDFVGRRRLVPGAQLKDERLKARAIRQAGNFPIQGGAQELIKMSMAKIQPLIDSLQRQGHYVVPLAQVHDEIVFEVAEDIVYSFAAECQGIMENIAVVSTGLKTDAEFSGVSWGDLYPLWKEAA